MTKRFLVLAFALLCARLCSAQTPTLIFGTGFEFRDSAGGLWSTPFAGPTSGQDGDDPHGFSYNQHGNYPISSGTSTPYSGRGAGVYQQMFNPSFPTARSASGVAFLAGRWLLGHHLWGPTWINARIKFDGHGGADTAKTRFFYLVNATGTRTVDAYWNNNKTVSLRVGGVTRATTVNPMPTATGAYVLFQMYTSWGNNDSLNRIIINGETLTSTVGWSTLDSLESILWGTIDPGNNTNDNCRIVFDDIFITQTAQADTSATWRVSYPAADNAINHWTKQDGTTSNMFNVVKTMPPTGGTTYLKNTNAGGNDKYDVTMQDYLTAGMPANGTVYMTYASVRHAQKSSTGADTGSVAILSNPTDPTAIKFLFGGAQGAFSTDLYGYACGLFGNAACVNNFWYNQEGVSTTNPTVTAGTQPVVEVNKVEATSNETDIDGVYLNFAFILSSSTRQPMRIGRKH